MTATTVTTLSDLFWIAANEYLAEPDEEVPEDAGSEEFDEYIARKFSCVAVHRAAQTEKIPVTEVDKILESAGINIGRVGWYSSNYTREEAQLGRYTFLLFLSLYCEDEGI